MDLLQRDRYSKQEIAGRNSHIFDFFGGEFEISKFRYREFLFMTYIHCLKDSTVLHFSPLISISITDSRFQTTTLSGVGQIKTASSQQCI